MLPTLPTFSPHSMGTHNFPLVENWPWDIAMPGPRNRSGNICRCFWNPHKHEGKEGQEGWGYWSLRSVLETHLVLSQCQCQLATTQVNPAPGRDIQMSGFGWHGDLCYKPEDVCLQPNKEILLSIPIPPFSSKLTVSSSLLLAQWLCLLLTLVSSSTYLYAFACSSRSSWRNIPPPKKKPA